MFLEKSFFQWRFDWRTRLNRGDISDKALIKLILSNVNVVILIPNNMVYQGVRKDERMDRDYYLIFNNDNYILKSFSMGIIFSMYVDGHFLYNGKQSVFT